MSIIPALEREPPDLIEFRQLLSTDAAGAVKRERDVRINFNRLRILNRLHSQNNFLFQDEGRSALHIACEKGYQGIIEALIDAGASVDSTDNVSKSTF